MDPAWEVAVFQRNPEAEASPSGPDVAGSHRRDAPRSTWTWRDLVWPLVAALALIVVLLVAVYRFRPTQSPQFLYRVDVGPANASAPAEPAGNQTGNNAIPGFNHRL